MIHKVNGPTPLTLIRGAKSAENDPGGSSGSGMTYDGPPPKQKEEDSEGEDTKKKPKLAIVSELEKAGMTEVVKDFYEHKNSESSPASPGLTTTKYQADTSRTKGLLLNKKAE